MATLASNLRHMMAVKNYCIEDLSRLTSLHVSTIYQILEGKTKRPYPKNLLKLSSALECTPEDLLGEAIFKYRKPLVNREDDYKRVVTSHLTNTTSLLTPREWIKEHMPPANEEERAVKEEPKPKTQQEEQPEFSETNHLYYLFTQLMASATPGTDIMAEFGKQALDYVLKRKDLFINIRG